MFSKGRHKQSDLHRVPSLLSADLHVLGNMICEGALDVNSSVSGNITCCSLTLRENAKINGDITADILHVYGQITGIIKARFVHLHKGCKVEGIVMHESLIIDDGAYIDGKCKRTDRVHVDVDAFYEIESGRKILADYKIV